MGPNLILIHCCYNRAGQILLCRMDTPAFWGDSKNGGFNPAILYRHGLSLGNRDTWNIFPLWFHRNVLLYGSVVDICSHPS